MNRRGINGEVWGLFFYKPKLVRKKTANRQHRQTIDRRRTETGQTGNVDRTETTVDDTT